MTAKKISAQRGRKQRSCERSCFVIGTDVGVGKTLIASALVHLLREHGTHTVGMKPVAAGANLDHGRWRQKELEQLAAAGSFSFPARALSPYIFPLMVAPHLAAELAGVEMRLEEILDSFDVLATWADAVVIDGVGGFRVPLGTNFDSADLATALKLPLILVVGIKSGCMNHALLTAEAVRARDLVLAGWVANVIDRSLPEVERIVSALESRLGAPCLAYIPHMESPEVDAVAERFSIDVLLAAFKN